MKERRGTGETLPSQPQLLPRTQVPKLDVFGASGWGPQTQLVMPGRGCLGPSLWEGCCLQAVAQLSGEASPTTAADPRGRDGWGDSCLAQGPGWACIVLRRVGRSWSSVSGCAPWAGAGPHPQCQLFSLLLSQEFTVSLSSNPTLLLAGCVTLGRSPCLSESQALKMKQ